MKYRIKIERIENNKYYHEHNIMIETANIKNIIKRLRNELICEIHDRLELLKDYLNRKEKSLINKIIDETPDGIIDFESKGNDISKEEFLRNEMIEENQYEM